MTHTSSSVIQAALRGAKKGQAFHLASVCQGGEIPNVISRIVGSDVLDKSPFTSQCQVHSSEVEALHIRTYRSLVKVLDYILILGLLTVACEEVRCAQQGNSNYAGEDVVIMLFPSTSGVESLPDVQRILLMALQCSMLGH